MRTFKLRTKTVNVLYMVNLKKLKEIKIVEDEKDGKKNIDNHSSQNYNVEHFCICTHEQSLVLRDQ